MKFDLVIMNPPYQDKSENDHKGAGNVLWPKFVRKAFSILKDGGFMSAVHPSGWRNMGGRLHNFGSFLKNKQILYLEIHNADDGMKTFGANTRYDWYVAKNSNYVKKTIFRGEDGVESLINLNSNQFIPNVLHQDIFDLFAKDGEPKVEILYNCNYHSHSGPVQKDKSSEYKYPCIQHVSAKDNKPSCIYYSNTNKLGHFGIPKVTFGVQVSGVFVDKEGCFGNANHCQSILDQQENLENIAKAMLSKRFINLMKMCDVGGNRDRYNRRVISLFRKDFWKEFAQ